MVIIALMQRNLDERPNCYSSSYLLYDLLYDQHLFINSMISGRS